MFKLCLLCSLQYHFGRGLPVVQSLSLVFVTVPLRPEPTRCSISVSCVRYSITSAGAYPLFKLCLLCSLQYHFGRGLPVVQLLSLVFVTALLRPGPTRCSISVSCVRYSTTSAGAYPLFNLCLLCSLQHYFGRDLPVVQSLSLVFVTVPLRPGPTRCSMSVSCVHFSTTSAGAYPLFNLCLLCSLQHYFGRALPVVQLFLLCSLQYHFGRGLPVVQSLSLVFVTVPLRPGPTRCSISVSCVRYSTTSAGAYPLFNSFSCVRYSTTSAGAYPLFNLCLLCSLQHYFGRGLPVVQSLSLVFVTALLRPGPTRCSMSVSCVHFSTTSAGAYPLFNLCLLCSLQHYFGRALPVVQLFLLCSLQYHFGRGLPVVQSLSLVFVTVPLRPGPTRCSISVSCVRYSTTSAGAYPLFNSFSCVRYSTTSAGAYPLFNLCLLCSLQHHFGRGLPVVQSLSLVFVTALLRPGPTRCSISVSCVRYSTTSAGAYPLFNLCLLCSLQHYFGRGLPVVQSLSLVFVTALFRPGPTRCSISVSCVRYSTTSAGAYPLFNLCLLCSLQHYFGRGLPVVQSLSLVFVTALLRPGPTRCSISVSCVRYSTTSAGAYPLFNLCLLCSLQHYFGRGLPVVQSLSLVFVTALLRPGPTRCSISVSCVRYSTTSAGAYPLFNLCLSDIIDEDMSKNHRR